MGSQVGTTMARTTLTLVITIALWALVDGKGVESPREIEMRSNAEVVRSLALATDRNMQSWWVTYNNTIDFYNLIKNNTICQNHTLNTIELDHLESQLANIISVWEDKGEQLAMFYAILANVTFNATGLFDDFIDWYNQQYAKFLVENATLTWEEENIENLKSEVDDKVCPCQWTDWTNYTSCWSPDYEDDCKTKTNPGLMNTPIWDYPTQNRSRDIEWPARNGGANCTGPDFEVENCTTLDPCPIDCVWSEWSEFGTCYPNCGPGLKNRTRYFAVDPEFNGADNCTMGADDDIETFNSTMNTIVTYDTEDCNYMDDLENQVDAQISLIQQLAEQLKNNSIDYIDIIPLNDSLRLDGYLPIAP